MESHGEGVVFSVYIIAGAASQEEKPVEVFGKGKCMFTA